ncbi:MAG: bifunctional hydroxymethylpyrimidine kinase/phosphomethylpyrimidine kinase [Promethearchaeota archaeon]
MKRVLTIAGSDSGGGAGIQADLKAFSARGVFGMSAITALTAQNTLGVDGVYEIPCEFVESQIKSVMEDIGVDAWKIGMLSNSRIIEVVAKLAKAYQVSIIVLDPVMVAKSGDLLLKEEAKNSLIKMLIPVASVITPNIHETTVITGIEITSYDRVKEAAKMIHKMGADNVLIKGGHINFAEDAIDILYDGASFTEFSANRIKTKNTHGTGCTYASAITAELAKGNTIIDAIHIAKAYLTSAIIGADLLQIGNGCGPTNHFQGKIVDVDLELIKVRKEI